jgi:hypothetical protein
MLAAIVGAKVAAFAACCSGAAARVVACARPLHF